MTADPTTLTCLIDGKPYHDAGIGPIPVINPATGYKYT